MIVQAIEKFWIYVVCMRMAQSFVASELLIKWKTHDFRKALPYCTQALR